VKSFEASEGDYEQGIGVVVMMSMKVVVVIAVVKTVCMPSQVRGGMDGNDGEWWLVIRQCGPI
jgi:hypothetical protein